MIDRLGEIGPGAAAAIPVLNSLLQDDDENIREAAKETLKKVQGSRQDADSGLRNSSLETIFQQLTEAGPSTKSSQARLWNEFRGMESAAIPFLARKLKKQTGTHDFSSPWPVLLQNQTRL
ncbi:MAG: hypothetical protein O2960_08265 [Verrucomicrobia bacterium]|nr:hypothetical protein [Verrucomicrobiota bacterium]